MVQYYTLPTRSCMMNKIEKTLISMEVAEMVEKAHNKLLRDIREYTSQLDESKIGHTDFFTENTYQDACNRVKPCYLVTKKGCEFIANKLTGIKGTAFTAKYINRFHEMEEIIAAPVIAEQRALTTDDYIKAASLVASCRNERLPYVLGFLEQGGFNIPEIEQPQTEADDIDIALIGKLIDQKGISLNALSRMTNICKASLSYYKNGRHRPSPERYAMLIEVLS